MKSLFILILVLASSVEIARSQAASAKEIQWYSFEDAVAQSKVNPKKLFIDVYTNWCGWCKKMDATTFKDDMVVDYVNAHFYAVKLNAETRDTIKFVDKLFTYQPQYKANEIALSLLGGKMSYPTYVLLDEEFNMLTPVPGYMDGPTLMNVLQYFGNNIHKNMTWEEYTKSGK